MIDLTCKKCGNPTLVKKNGLFVCQYCGSSFLPDENEQRAMQTSKKTSETHIDLRSDIDILLDKCRSDPNNARRYANRILDIDPTNKEALHYL